MSKTLLACRVSQLTLTANMTFNGTWKVDRNDNYEKFMEKMGELWKSIQHIYIYYVEVDALAEKSQCVSLSYLLFV